MEPSQLQTFIEGLLKRMDVEVESVSVTGHPGRAGRTIVAILVQDPALLVGPGGEHLRSLNTIAKRLIEAKYGEEAATFLIDVNHHHEGQMDVVREKARGFAQRARLFKHDVEMPPLSAYERLVVHELFAEDPEIKTESIGEGAFRHIVLKYKS